MNYQWIGDNLWMSILEKELSAQEINDLKKFENIEYLGVKKSDNVEYHVFQMRNVNDTFIRNLIENIFEKLKSEKTVTLIDVFKNIYTIFKYNRIPDKEKELRGDLAEILFLKLLEKNNIDWTKYYISDKNEFDIQTPSINIEIKSYNNSKKNITTSLKQLIPGDCKNRYFIIVEIENTTNKKNILQLITSLKYKNNVTAEIEEKWNLYGLDFLNKITADENNKICYLNNNLLPHVEITPNKCFVNAKFELNVSFALDNSINDLKFSSFDDLDNKLNKM